MSSVRNVVGREPTSILGKCLFSWMRNEGEILISLKSYFDGSTDAQTSQWLSLGGFASDDKLWTEFENGWNDILKDRIPPAAYCHMQELTRLNGEFDWRKGWNDILTSQLIWDLLIYLQKFDKNKFVHFSCTVDLHAHAKIIGEGISLPSPIELCCDYCPQLVLKWYFKDYPGIFEKLNFFFDANEQFEAVFRDKWNRERVNPISLGGSTEQVFD